MWLNDLSVAIDDLFTIYGLSCCVQRIAGNIITMTNGDRWGIDVSDGHIFEISKENY